MKTKYEIEITVNDLTNKGIMEVYDDSLKLNINNQEKVISFTIIKSNIIENGLLKITLVDDTILVIKTVNVEIVNSFIFLQRNEDGNYPITFKSKEYYTRKSFKNGFITGFVIIFLWNTVIRGMWGNDLIYLLPACFFWGLIFGLINIVRSVNGMHIDRASADCPHCHKNMVLNRKIGEETLQVDENEIGKMNCIFCGKMNGMKHNHLYKLTPYNESEFGLTSTQGEKQTTTSEINQVVKQEEKTSNSNSLEKYSELEKLKELFDKEIITQEEFEKKKKEILNL